MKKLITAVMVGAFALSSASLVMASTVKCTVDSVSADKVTMTCKKAKKLKVGDKVKVKSAKKQALEGC